MRVLVFLLLFTSSLCAREPEVLLLAAPRSGMHWIAYSLCTVLDKNFIMNRGPTEVDLFEGHFRSNTSGVIYGAHNPKDLWIEKDGEKHDKLILIVRNYREALLRHFKSNPRWVLAELKEQAKFRYLDESSALTFILYRDHYFNNLRVYDFWDPSKRLLIYYEDFLVNPRPILEQVLHFLGSTDRFDALNTYFRNLEEHSTYCLGLYDSMGGSHSKGKDPLFHTKQIGFEMAMQIDQEAEALFPHLYNNYLKRYKLSSRSELQ
ncbi:MAG: sulfotransferase domain-containing protein [Verrucomicrobia bacterium]|nr:sulfotransferase domain-containing protein [Verrucomicrobiota bacterium]